MQESLTQLFSNLNLEGFTPYLENTTYLISFLAKFFYNSKDKSVERKKPSLNEIIDKDEVKVSHDNDFVDVLVAIEEEMAAVRELYVGGYISKGVYISETDRLYEKAKIFGL